MYLYFYLHQLVEVAIKDVAIHVCTYLQTSCYYPTRAKDTHTYIANKTVVLWRGLISNNKINIVLATG